MSTLKTNRVQLGLSGTATQNFTFDASAADGTMKFARGVAGATTQDILTINSLGEVDFPQLVRSYGANGYQKLPGGLIIQWGHAIIGTNTLVTLPMAFPNNHFVCVGSDDDSTAAGYVAWQAISLSQARATSNGTFGCGFIAIGN